MATADRKPNFKVKADFLKKWLSDPQAYPDEFKAWLINFVGQSPNLTLPYASLPKGYRGDFSELHIKNSGSNTEQDIFWERNNDGSVIAKIAGQNIGSSPNQQSKLQLLANQPDSGGSAQASIEAEVVANGTPIVKNLLDSTGASDWLFSSGTFTPSSSPPSGTDGDVWVYDGGTYYWMFVHDSSDATYPWKFVGGPPLASSSTSAQNSSGGQAFFSAPTVTVPRSGVYKYTWMIQCGTAGNVSAPTTIQWYGYMRDSSNANVQIGGNSHAYFYASATGISYYWLLTIPDQEATLTSGHVLALYGHASGWDLTSPTRSLSITPIRVA